MFSSMIARLDGSIWEIEPGKLNSIMRLLELRFSGGHLPEAEIAAAVSQRRLAPPRDERKRIGVLPIFGTLVQRAGSMEKSSGVTDPDDIGREFDSMMADDSIGSIVLQVDSPGGVVFGIKELSDRIYAARKTKRIVGVADGYAASAAYKILSSASEVYVSPSSLSGSIGVYSVHVDASRKARKEGLNFSLVSAGKYKTEGHPYAPLEREAREAMQREVNFFYDEFVNVVARNRNVSTSRVKSGFGEGRVLPAPLAVKEGLADGILPFEGVIQKVARESVSRERARGDVAARRDRLAALTGEPKPTISWSENMTLEEARKILRDIKKN